MSVRSRSDGRTTNKADSPLQICSENITLRGAIPPRIAVRTVQGTVWNVATAQAKGEYRKGHRYVIRSNRRDECTARLARATLDEDARRAGSLSAQDPAPGCALGTGYAHVPRSPLVHGMAEMMTTLGAALTDARNRVHSSRLSPCGSPQVTLLAPWRVKSRLWQSSAIAMH